MKRIKYIYDNYGFRSSDSLDFIEVVVRSKSITFRYGKKELFLTKLITFDFDIISRFSNITVPKEDKDFIIMMLDGWNESIQFDNTRITNAPEEETIYFPLEDY
ncbi:hypothetical protein [Candidatus Xianfuyuplasma coldseepsis]|uniref:Uncharacterized protein n=1 Tax=Candidatus Xianfuyuplasma coldseepsis TaxID=2782163 RepID=A0A7L7KR10_9MOLU|nr:hypothetical protein [Xianfuyuplasma coldseepsis]QMS85117.1 hypothetical protein G4Z02_04950 [Xianfuyuplasma coldseepsis]